MGLTGELSASAQADYLSGVLMGHEVASVARRLESISTLQVVLCGEPDLCRRYAMALEVYGFKSPSISAQATARGLWEVAVAAGLLRPAPNQARTNG